MSQETSSDQELQEIADGAYGDNPMRCGLARDALAAPVDTPPEPVEGVEDGQREITPQEKAIWRELQSQGFAPEDAWASTCGIVDALKALTLTGNADTAVEEVERVAKTLLRAIASEIAESGRLTEADALPLIIAALSRPPVSAKVGEVVADLVADIEREEEFAQTSSAPQFASLLCRVRQTLTSQAQEVERLLWANGYASDRIEAAEQELERQRKAIERWMGTSFGFERQADTERAGRLAAEQKVERLRAALERISEGNLGDQPWQANYERIREVARTTLAETGSSEGASS